jgi:hypothetical protein
MTTYILIILTMTTAGVTTSSAGPFQNLDACRKAMTVVEGRFDGFGMSVTTVCVEDR